MTPSYGARRFALAGVLLALSACPAVAETSLARQIVALTSEPAVARDHWGVTVTTLDGKPIVALNEGQLFQPASNAKLFTTAAAMALLGEDERFRGLETRVVAHGTFATPQMLEGDLYLVGGGDANLSGRRVPYVPPGERPKNGTLAREPLQYLKELADKVVATGLKTVSGDVVGDDTLFPYEPYPEDWAIDDAVWGYGAPVSALTVNDNQLVLKIVPGAGTGDPAVIRMEPEVAYYRVEGLVTTGAAKSANTVRLDRAIGLKVLRVHGSIPLDAAADAEEIAIDDPAEFAAMVFRQMLVERGVEVTGRARAKHRLPTESRSFREQVAEALDLSTLRGGGCFDCGRPDLEAHEQVLASHRSVPLAQDVVVTNKESQNLHAELLLHHLGRAVTGAGSTAQGVRVVRQFLRNAGLDRDDFVFFDGSGLSGHDLVTPRAMARLLVYAVAQPWFAAWRASLPVGGVDGSLAGRFKEAPLKGHVFAKTGTLGEARALSGYVECASGRTVIFSIMDGNHLPGTSADRDVMDRVVAAIAAAN